MITDDEVMRVLEQANPASVDDPIQMIDIAGYRAVLDAKNTTMSLIDHEPAPSEPNSGRRWLILTAAAAAVVAIALVASRDDDPVSPADQPSPTVTVPPTLPPRAMHNTSGREQLAPGTYFVDEVSGISTPRIFATIGTGWSNPYPHINSTRITTKGWDIGKGETDPDDETTHDPQNDIGVMTFSHPVAVYTDACHWKEGGYHPGPVDTVDGFVAALTEQQGWAEVTAPTDISIDGYVGKAFQRTAPTDISDCSTRNYGTRLESPGIHPHFRSWDNSDELSGGGFYYEPDQIETLWVLDIEGTVVVISTAAWPEPSAGASPDFAADVLDSIRIEQPSPTVTVPPTNPSQALTELVVPPLGSPIECEPARCPWSPELTAHTLKPPIAGSGSQNLAVSPDGTLVALDPIAGTLTWYEDEPRVVLLTADVVRDGYGQLAAIGPHDIAYIASPAWDTVVATAPSGEEITQLAWHRNRHGAPSFQTAAGLGTGTTWLVPDSFAVPWVDLDGDPIIDSRPYPTAAVTDAGIEVRLGDEEWLLTEEAGTRLVPLDFLARSDGGVVMVLDTYVVELSPDGSIGRYVLNAPTIVLPDGSLIVEYGSQVARLIPPA